MTSVAILFFFSSPPSSALDVLIDCVKDIVHPSTGKPLVFVCKPCVHAFLYPTGAVREYLSFLSSHPDELRAHETAATLRQSSNRRHISVHPTGVVLETCSICEYQGRAPSKKYRMAGHTPCLSARHKGGRPADARYTPTPSLFHLLWPPEVADVESDASPGKRRKICGGCRSSSQRQIRLKRLRAADSAAVVDHGSPTTTAGGPAVAGLDMPSVAASSQQELSILPLPEHPPPLAEGPGAVPPTSSRHANGEGRSTDAAIRGGPAMSVPPVAPRRDTSRVWLSTAGFAVLLDARDWPTEHLLMDLLERYESFGDAERCHFETSMTKYLRETRPSEVSFAFKNGVNRRYALAPPPVTRPVGPRQLRRRLQRVRELGGAHGADTSPHLSLLVAILRAAHREKEFAVVSVQGLPLLSPKAQAQFTVKHYVSAMMMCALRQALGGSNGPIASREVLRQERDAMSAEPWRQVYADDRCAHLISLCGALKALFSELVESGQFADRHVRGPDGAPVPHTTPFQPSNEDHTLHTDTTADVHICIGLDKGGRETATSKLVVTKPNQLRPMSRANSILLLTLPCVKDTNAELHAMIGP